MKATVEQQLIGSKPEARGNTAFTARTMQAVRTASAHETFSTVTRKRNSTKKESLFMKVKTIPALGVLLGGAIIVGGSVYAAANWFGTDASIQRSANTVTVSAKDCPVPMQQAITQHYPQATYSLSNTWQITKPGATTEDQLEQAQLVSCEQDAITAIAHKLAPNIFFGENSTSKQLPTQAGLYSARGNYGTITAISGSGVTINDIPARYINQSWARVAQTFSLDNDVKVLADGQPSASSNLRVGDQVYFLFQNLGNSPTPPASSTELPTTGALLQVIAKTQYDYRNLDAQQSALNSGAIKLKATKSPIGG